MALRIQLFFVIALAIISGTKCIKKLWTYNQQWLINMWRTDAMPLVARLDSHIKSMTALKGDDVCAGCDEVYCNQQPACGYVQVKFSDIGSNTVYYTLYSCFFVEYSNVKEWRRVCCQDMCEWAE